jgi:arylsulfatase A-like enzyme
MAGAKKPNILVIMSDDIGTWNISAYHRGMMGGRSSGRGANTGANGKATTATAIAASWAQ